MPSSIHSSFSRRCTITITATVTITYLVDLVDINPRVNLPLSLWIPWLGVFWGCFCCDFKPKQFQLCRLYLSSRAARLEICHDRQGSAVTLFSIQSMVARFYFFAGFCCLSFVDCRFVEFNVNCKLAYEWCCWSCGDGGCSGGSSYSVMSCALGFVSSRDFNIKLVMTETG